MINGDIWENLFNSSYYRKPHVASTVFGNELWISTRVSYEVLWLTSKPYYPVNAFMHAEFCERLPLLRTWNSLESVSPLVFHSYFSATIVHCPL